MTTHEKPARVLSIDAYRGLVMFLMIASIMAIYRVATNFPDSPVWQTLGFHTSHVAWRGCSLHDMIQPSFSFLVGVALPFSLAARQGQGQGFGRMLFHAAVRALLLIGLGIFLRSGPRSGDNDPLTNFTFVDTLTQIGLGYVFLFLLGFRSFWWHLGAAAIILVGYWAWFAFSPAPGPDYDYTAVNVKTDWPHHFSGFESHWNINSNPAAEFDRWFLNRFPRHTEFRGNDGGYATLNFIPTLATMIFGLIAGSWLHGGLARSTLWGRLFAAGVVLVLAGYALDRFGYCPLVKPIWTPSWALFSGGVCFLMMLGFTVLFDGNSPLRYAAYPLVILGANSIFLYCLNALTAGWVKQTLTIHLKWPERKFGFSTYNLFGSEYASIVSGALVILIFWLILFWMYRKRIFVKI